MNILQQVAKKIQWFITKSRFEAQVDSLSSITVDPNAEIVLAILCSNKNVSEAIATVFSFHLHFKTPFHVHIHDDGSINSKSIEKLKNKIKSVKIVGIEESDKKVNTHLNNHQFKELKNFRDRFVLAKKLIDIPLYAEGKYILQLDTDILFHQHPFVLEKVINEKENLILFNKDYSTEGAYSYPISEINTYLKSQITPAINTGLVLYQLDTTNAFAFYENILKSKLTLTSHWHEEQTLFAMYVTTQGAQPLSEEYDVLGRFWRKGNDKFISQHYCNVIRPYYYTHFSELVNQLPKN